MCRASLAFVDCFCLVGIVCCLLCCGLFVRHV